MADVLLTKYRNMENRISFSKLELNVKRPYIFLFVFLGFFGLTKLTNPDVITCGLSYRKCLYIISSPVF